MAEPDAQRKIKSEAESSDLGKAEDAGAAEGEYHFLLSSSFFQVTTDAISVILIS